MATRVKDKPADKLDDYVEQQLDRTERRVRFIDLTAALLGLAAGTFAYVVAIMLLDRALDLSSFARVVSLLLYLVGAGVFVAYAVVRPLRWRVNPRYAARLLEGTLESDRNHVVNWVDLRGMKLPGVIKASLGQRAAKDLSQTDAEHAVSAKRAYFAGGAFALALLVFGSLFFLFGMTVFGSLFSRAVAPFGKAGTLTRTQVSIVKPEGGDAAVTVGQPITIVAKVTGRVPDARAKDAPCLLYRHDESEPYRQRYLQAEAGGEWAATIAPADVGQGFWYKVTAGDARTPEYQVTTRPKPLIRYFQVLYRHRAYVNRADRLESSRKLEALEGTEAEVTIWTNRDVKKGKLSLFRLQPGEMGTVVEVPPPAPQPAEVAGELVEGKPQMLRFRVPLWKSCKYRLEYETTEGENQEAKSYADPRPEDVIVTPDNLPQAKITRPAEDVKLPPDGHLEIEGTASDDVGVARVELFLRVDGMAVKAIPYLADKLGKAGFGTPAVVAYRHLLELPSLLDADGKKVELKPGMVVEYRLLAADACDFRMPEQHALSEPAYRITIAEAKKEDEPKKQQQRDDARKRQEEHEKNEADRLKEEKKRQDEARAQAEEQTKEEKKQQEEQRAREEGKGKKDKGERGKEEGPEKQQPDPQQEKKNKETEAKAEEIKEELDREEKEKRGEGKGRGDKDDKGNKGEGKNADKKDGKEDGKAADKDDKASEGKDGEGKGADKKDGKGEGKQPSSARPPQKEGKAGESKGEGKGKSDGKEKGERRPETPPRPDEPKREGDGKKSDTQGSPAENARPGQNAPKEDRPSESRPPDKQEGNSSESKGANKDKDDRAGKSKSSEPKDKAGEGKPGNDPRPDPKGATPEDVKNAAENLKHADPKQRQRAAADLNEIANKAKDAETQKAARKAIEDAKKNGDLDQEGRVPGERKGDNEKPEDGMEGKGPGKPAEQGEQSGERRQNRAGNAKDRQDRAEGNDPGEGADKDRTGSNNGGGGQETAKKKQAAERARASQLQLERFKNKVDKDVLQKLNMSKEQYDRFLSDYAAMAKRQREEAEREERLPKSSGGKQSASGGKQLDPTGKIKDDVRTRGQSMPPPGYRDQHHDVHQRLKEVQK